jgi:cytidylate kinase
VVDDLLQRVQAANFIVIAGPSGSGKSSVARAGLFQALRHGRLDKSDAWLLAAMTPGGNPIEQLASVYPLFAYALQQTTDYRE